MPLLFHGGARGINLTCYTFFSKCSGNFNIIVTVMVLLTLVKFNWVHYRMRETTLLTMLLCCGIISG